MLHRRNTEGAAAVEFALLLPLLILILMAIVEYGYVFYVDVTVVNAAREGARAAVTVELPEDAKARAKYVAGLYLTNNLPVKARPGSKVEANFSGDNIEVVTRVDPFEPLIGLLPSNALPDYLTGSSTMRWEWVPSP